MATQTYEQLIAGANKIKENELPESNTHDIVGEQLLQMTNKMQEESSNTTKAFANFETDRVKKTTELNISHLYPTLGVDGSNRYTLAGAIAQVEEKYRSIQGVKVSFVNENNETESWEYKGNSWVVDSFSEVGARKIINIQKEKVDKNSNSETVSNDSSDAFYFTDANGNVVAKIDKNGLKAVDFIDKDNGSILELISNIKKIIDDYINENKEKKIADSSDTFVFQDKENRVIAKIDKDGLNIKQIIIRDSNGKEVKRINPESSDIPQAMDIPVVCGDKVYKMQFDASTINFLPCLYPEGIIGGSEKINAEVNSGRMAYLDSRGNTTTNFPLKVTANGYKDVDKNINLVISPFSKLQNTKINVLCPGDSLTDMGYVSMMNAITDRYNADKNNINITYVGTIKEKLEVELDGQQYTPRACNEGRSGWDIGNYLRHAVFINPRGNAILSYSLMTGKVGWDSLGLGSRGTGSYTYEYTGSSEDKKLLHNTCHGFYEADITEDLWHWCLQRAQKYNLYSFRYNEQDYNFNGRFTGTSGSPSYSGIFDENEQSCVSAFMQYVFNKPDIPFYDIGTVKSSNGEYAANFTTYINRYRTLNDNGERLAEDSPEIGSLVEDVNAYDVCTPTHVCLMMSYNSADFFGGTGSTDGCEQVINDLYKFASLIKEAFPDVKIAYACNRAYGVDFPAKWTDLGFFPERFIGAFTTEIHRLMVDNEQLKSIGDYVPIFECQSIVGEINAKAISTLDGDKKIRYNGDTLHAGNTPSGWTDRASMYIAWIASTIE